MNKQLMSGFMMSCIASTACRTWSMVLSGTDFSVSEKKVTVLEGKSATVTAKAGGAQKVYWIVKDGGQETIADVDTFHYTINAGRVTGGKSFTLQFKAVYANEVRTKEIAVTIEENVPDPIFTLKAPAKWDGRETIEVIAQVSNLKEMQSKGAGDLAYTWTVSGLAVVKEVTPGRLILKRAQNSGTMTATATVNNGDKPVTQSIQTAVKEPAKDAWIQRVPEKDEKPANNQFYARDDQNEGTLYYNGVLSNAAEVVFLKLYAGNKLVKAEYQKFVDLIAPLMEQDLYGVVPKADLTAPNVKRAFFTTEKRDEIALEFSQNMAWNNDSACLFAFDYQSVGHFVSGNVPIDAPGL